MDRSPSNELTFPQAAFRWLAVIAFSIAFLTIASVIDPSSSHAVTSLGREGAPDKGTRLTVPPTSRSLGTLEGRTGSIAAYATPAGPLYSLIDPYGRLVAGGMGVEDLSGLLDGFDPSTMRASSAIGIVDEADLDH